MVLRSTQRSRLLARARLVPCCRLSSGSSEPWYPGAQTLNGRILRFLHQRVQEAPQQAAKPALRHQVGLVKHQQKAPLGELSASIGQKRLARGSEAAVSGRKAKPATGIATSNITSDTLGNRSAVDFVSRKRASSNRRTPTLLRRIRRRPGSPAAAGNPGLCWHRRSCQENR